MKCYVTCLHGRTLLFSQFLIFLFFNMIVVIIDVNGDVKEQYTRLTSYNKMCYE